MRIVFTNGVFDIIHNGHISLLKYARSLGDKLVVGINSDSSVKKLKGEDRPIIGEENRKEHLLELRCVDDVYIFYDETPEALIKAIRPNVLVKGPAEKNNIIPGAYFVESYGGKVVVPDWDVQISTTRLIEKICKTKSL